MTRDEIERIIIGVNDCRTTHRRNSVWINCDGGAMLVVVSFVDQEFIDAAEAARAEHLAKPWDEEPTP